MADYTVIQPTDTDHSENINATLGHPALIDYVRYGLEVQNLDAPNGQFDLTEGKVHFERSVTQAIVGEDADGNPIYEDRHRALITSHLDARTNLAIANVNARNYVWARANAGTDDSPKIDVNDTGVASSDDSLLIGILDAEDTDSDGVAENLTLVEQPNRGPNLEPESVISPQEVLTLGKEIAPTDGLHVGPIEVSPDARNYPLINLPVTSNLTGGDAVGYQIGLDEDPALTVEGKANGSGGLQQASVTANFAVRLADTTRRTLSDDVTLTEADAQFQNMDPGGVARAVTLPTERNGLVFVIANRADAAENITINDDGGATLATVSQDEVAYAVSDGDGWMVFAAAGGVS